VVKVLLCDCSVQFGGEMAIQAIHSPCAWEDHCSIV
jgi:hypothetical protein